MELKTFVTDCPTFGLWFERFMKGMHASRMGDDRRPDAAIANEVMHELIKKIELDFLLECDNLTRARYYYVRAGLFFLGCYLASLRGEEAPRILRKEFIDLNNEALRGVNRHCVLPMYGRFKGEQGTKSHFA